MAWLLIEVDNIREAGKREKEYKELEGIIFRDDNGNERKFGVVGLTPWLTSEFRKKYPDIDWDENNYHLEILVGEPMK